MKPKSIPPAFHQMARRPRRPSTSGAWSISRPRRTSSGALSSVGVSIFLQIGCLPLEDFSRRNAANIFLEREDFPYGARAIFAGRAGAQNWLPERRRHAISLRLLAFSISSVNDIRPNWWKNWHCVMFRSRQRRPGPAYRTRLLLCSSGGGSVGVCFDFLAGGRDDVVCDL